MIQQSRIHCGGEISMKIPKYCKNQNRKYFLLKNYVCNIRKYTKISFKIQPETFFSGKLVLKYTKRA